MFSAKKINDMMRELENEWGALYIAYYGDLQISDPNRPEVVIRNKTDEGLPPGGGRIEYRGEMFVETLEKAYREEVE